MRDKSLIISFASSMRFLVSSTAIFDKPVKFPPGRLRLATSFRPTGSGTLTETIGIVVVHDGKRRQRSLRLKPIHPGFAWQVRPQERRTVHTAHPGNAFLRRCSDLPHSRNLATPVAALPSRLLLLRLCSVPQNTNSAYSSRLLRARGTRPCNRRTAEKRDELAPSHGRLPRVSRGHRIGSAEYFERG